MNELPFLDLDAATQLYLPHATAHAHADYRFVYRAPNGNSEPLLARLCPFWRDKTGDHAAYFPVLRPESAEPERVFTVCNLRYCIDQGALYPGAAPPMLTPQQAAHWDWAMFEAEFVVRCSTRELARFWRVEHQGQTQLYRCLSGHALERLRVPTARGARSVSAGQSASCRWNTKPEGASELDGLHWLRTSTAQFEGEMRAMWDDPQHEVHYSLRWTAKTEAEKDAVAFECHRGDWAQLRGIAKWVAQLRLSYHASGSSEAFEWNLAGESGAGRYPVSFGSLGGDGALLLWRRALTRAFDTPNFNAKGVRLGHIPLCVEGHIVGHESSFVEVNTPSAHELLEATLQLQTWARQNFSPANARILMDCLRDFDESQARRFTDSLRPNDL